MILVDSSGWRACRIDHHHVDREIRREASELQAEKTMVTSGDITTLAPGIDRLVHREHPTVWNLVTPPGLLDLLCDTLDIRTTGRLLRAEERPRPTALELAEIVRRFSP